MLETFSLASHGPVIPVIVIQRLEDAVPLAEALVAGGVRVLEVTLRTPVALQAMEAMAKVPGAIVGAGTLRSPTDVINAKNAGCQFGVSPGYTDALAAACKAEGLPLLPGVSTASEVMQANAAGFGFLKLFPAVAVSDGDVQKHWETVKDRFKAGWSSTIRAAFLPSKAAVEELRQKVAAGAPFDDTANALGAIKAGSMGQVSSASEELAVELRNLIGTLHKGELSPPAQVADGYLVFLCEDRQDTPERTLEQVRPQVLSAAQDQKRQRLFADWLDEREKKAAVKVASFYGKWNTERGAVN